jgi:hypothetical protein
MAENYPRERFISDLNLLEPELGASHARMVSGPRWIASPPGLVKVNVGTVMSKDTTLVAFIDVSRSLDDAFMGASVVVVQGYNGT